MAPVHAKVLTVDCNDPAVPCLFAHVNQAGIGKIHWLISVFLDQLAKASGGSLGIEPGHQQTTIYRREKFQRRAQEMCGLREHGVAGKERIGERAYEFRRPGSVRVSISRCSKRRNERPGIDQMNHARRERMAFRTFWFVAGGASVLTDPNRSSQGDPDSAWTAWTRCRTALRANSLKSSPTARAVFCQSSFSRTGTRTVSVSLIPCM